MYQISAIPNTYMSSIRESTISVHSTEEEKEGRAVFDDLGSAASASELRILSNSDLGLEPTKQKLKYLESPWAFLPKSPNASPVSKSQKNIEEVKAGQSLKGGVVHGETGFSNPSVLWPIQATISVPSPACQFTLENYWRPQPSSGAGMGPDTAHWRRECDEYYFWTRTSQSLSLDPY